MEMVGFKNNCHRNCLGIGSVWMVGYSEKHTGELVPGSRLLIADRFCSARVTRHSEEGILDGWASGRISTDKRPRVLESRWTNSAISDMCGFRIAPA